MLPKTAPRRENGGKWVLVGEFSDVLWKNGGNFAPEAQKPLFVGLGWGGGGVVSNMPEEKWGTMGGNGEERRKK